MMDTAVQLIDTAVNYVGPCSLMCWTLQSVLTTQLTLLSALSECATKKCVSCSIRRNPQFELRGFCSSDSLDIKYMMVLNKTFTGVYDLLGWRLTKLSWSSNNTRWEFRSGAGDVIAHCNDTEEYPLGQHR